MLNTLLEKYKCSRPQWSFTSFSSKRKRYTIDPHNRIVKWNVDLICSNSNEKFKKMIEALDMELAYFEENKIY